MADRQGAAEIKVRRERVVIIAEASGRGWKDDAGFWRGSSITDWDCFVELHGLDETDAALGHALRRCLKEARLVPPDWKGHSGEYDDRLASAFGLTSSRKLYPGMKNASVDWSGDEVTFIPTHHRRGSSFEGFPLRANRGHERIVLPVTASDAEFGSALRETIRRCL